MKHLTVTNTTLLCFSFSVLLLSPCAFSLEPNGQAAHGDQSFLTSTSRKLKVIHETIKTQKENDQSKMKAMGTVNKGELQHKGVQENIQKVEKEEREWEEGINPSELFTMDYHRVRRRRPIHNKALPVGP